MDKKNIEIFVRNATPPGRISIEDAPYKPFRVNRSIPSHAGLLNIVRDAKDAGHLWADAALAELAILTGMNYQFVRDVSFNRIRHEIKIAP